MKLTEGMAAVVTGGASGLGRASASALAEAGLKVTIFDVNEEAGQAHARDIGGHFARWNPWVESGLEQDLALGDVPHPSQH